MINTIPEEEKAHGTISNWTYLKYVYEGGNILLTILLILIFIAAEVCYIMKCTVEILLQPLYFRVALWLLVATCQSGELSINTFDSIWPLLFPVLLVGTFACGWPISIS